MAKSWLEKLNDDRPHHAKRMKLTRAGLAKGGLMLLPHMGSATVEGRVDMGEKVIINIKTFVDGHKPPDRVLEALL